MFTRKNNVNFLVYVSMLSRLCIKFGKVVKEEPANVALKFPWLGLPN